MIRHMSYVACDNCDSPAQLGDGAAEARSIAIRERFIRVKRGGRMVDICHRCVADPNGEHVSIPGVESDA